MIPLLGYCGRCRQQYALSKCITNMVRIFIVLIVLNLGMGCKKSKIKNGNGHLPRATTNGRGIFGCYVDDETYVARKQEQVSYNSETGYLFLENSNNAFQFRLFVYEGVFTEGSYSFDNTGEEWGNSNYTEFFGINVGGINELEITNLDLVSGIISGKFEIDLIAADGTIKIIRAGRFDLEMNVIG